VSRYQKCKTNLDFIEAKDGEWQWHKLDHMQVCTSIQTDNHASTSLLSFLQTGCPSCHPTNSVKALKAYTGLPTTTTTTTCSRYLSAERARPPLAGHGHGDGVSVISMSLYGAGRRYTMGAVRNAQLAPVAFPGWRLRFYVELSATKARYAAVPRAVLVRLRRLGAELVDAPADRLPPMMWRFTVCIACIP